MCVDGLLFVPFVLVVGTFYRSKPWWNAVWFKPAKGGINRFPNPSQKEICFQFILMCVDGLLFVPFVLVVGTVYRSFPWWRAVHFKPAKGGINRFPNPTQKKIAQGFVLICLDVCVLPFMLFVFGTAYRFPAVWEARADSKKSEQLRLELRDAHRKWLHNTNRPVGAGAKAEKKKSPMIDGDELSGPQPAAATETDESGEQKGESKETKETGEQECTDKEDKDDTDDRLHRRFDEYVKIHGKALYNTVLIFHDFLLLVPTALFLVLTAYRTCNIVDIAIAAFGRRQWCRRLRPNTVTIRRSPSDRSDDGSSNGGSSDGEGDGDNGDELPMANRVEEVLRFSHAYDWQYRALVWAQLGALCVDIPFFILAIPIIATLWRADKVLLGVSRRGTTVMERRVEVVRQLGKLLRDVLCVPFFLVLLGTLYKVPFLLLQMVAAHQKVPSGIPLLRVKGTRIAVTNLGRARLKIKVSKPAGLARVTNVKLRAMGPDLWKVVEKRFGSVVASAARSVMPVKMAEEVVGGAMMKGQYTNNVSAFSSSSSASSDECEWWIQVAPRSKAIQDKLEQLHVEQPTLTIGIQVEADVVLQEETSDGLGDAKDGETKEGNEGHGATPGRARRVMHHDVSAMKTERRVLCVMAVPLAALMNPLSRAIGAAPTEGDINTLLGEDQDIPIDLDTLNPPTHSLEALRGVNVGARDVFWLLVLKEFAQFVIDAFHLLLFALVLALAPWRFLGAAWALMEPAARRPVRISASLLSRVAFAEEELKRFRDHLVRSSNRMVKKGFSIDRYGKGALVPDHRLMRKDRVPENKSRKKLMVLFNDKMAAIERRYSTLFQWTVASMRPLLKTYGADRMPTKPLVDEHIGNLLLGLQHVNLRVEAHNRLIHDEYTVDEHCALLECIEEKERLNNGAIIASRHALLHTHATMQRIVWGSATPAPLAKKKKGGCCRCGWGWWHKSSKENRKLIRQALVRCFTDWFVLFLVLLVAASLYRIPRLITDFCGGGGGGGSSVGACRGRAKGTTRKKRGKVLDGEDEGGEGGGGRQLGRGGTLRVKYLLFRQILGMAKDFSRLLQVTFLFLFVVLLVTNVFSFLGEALRAKSLREVRRLEREAISRSCDDLYRLTSVFFYRETYSILFKAACYGLLLPAACVSEMFLVVFPCCDVTSRFATGVVLWLTFVTSAPSYVSRCLFS